MSLLKSNSVQIGQSSTATQNFTLAVPSSPDGTIKLARGNSGSTTADIFSVDAGGTITGATISGATINSSTINGGSITLGTAQASTSGTSIDFTGIPSWAKKITVMFNGVSTNGSSDIQIQLGDSGGIETTSYLGSNWQANTTNTLNSSGFIVADTAAIQIHHGSAIISLFGSNTWVIQSILGRSDAATSSICGGSKNLSDTLDRIRITTVNGTDTFDAGSINIMYEG